MSFHTKASWTIMPAACSVVLLLCGAAHGESICVSRTSSGAMSFSNDVEASSCERVVRSPATAVPRATPSGRSTRLKPVEGSVAVHANRYGVSKHLVRAVIQAESGGNSAAVSRKGARGIMQLMPATARRFDVLDPMDADQNIEGGVKYLSYLLDRYAGSIPLAVAAYNAGEGAVEKYGGIPPYRETRNYVRKVLDLAGGSGGVRSLSPESPAQPAPVRMSQVGGGKLVLEN